MPAVYNKRQHYPLPADAIYVGRPTLWGNPYVIGKDGNRQEVIEKYREYLKGNPTLIDAARKLLRDHDLVCWCAPLACHADILLEVANA